MKNIVTCAIWFLFTIGAIAQTKKQDSAAILIIDRMTDVIGDLQSCSFHLSTSNDVADTVGLVKKFASYEVYMEGPDKMLVNAHGWKGHRQFMYNGNQLAYYSFDENNYGMIPAPDNIISMIDSIHHMYDIEFPAADFFYPAFTDDLLENTDTVLYLGMIKIEDKEYLHILASNKTTSFQFWINNDAYDLPAKFVITDKTKPGNPQYEASFSNWLINPDLPDAMFDFEPPPGAARLRIASKTDR
ncbi:MAG TPA: DUF2092 domain-containing protein [Parafilimonas sp.]|nr:DUF2092 domain-containing protein [Parafilimonas sp.]